jgi:hypothetical protein
MILMNLGLQTINLLFQLQHSPWIILTYKVFQHRGMPSYTPTGNSCLRFVVPVFPADTDPFDPSANSENARVLI